MAAVLAVAGGPRAVRGDGSSADTTRPHDSRGWTRSLRHCVCSGRAGKWRPRWGAFRRGESRRRALSQPTIKLVERYVHVSERLHHVGQRAMLTWKADGARDFASSKNNNEQGLRAES